MAVKQINYDVDGDEALSPVLMELINTFPGLGTRTVEFSTLGKDAGIGFFPTSGAAIVRSKTSVTGRVWQLCAYPFGVVYRIGARTEDQRMKAKEFLDALGRWLERQPVTVDGTVCQILHYPKLENGQRRILEIKRTSPAYNSDAGADNIEDWAITLSCQYTNEFKR